MGRIAGLPEASILHFSHPHLLQLSNFQPQQTLSLSSCSGCNLNVSAGWIYTCNICKYFLHVSWSQMPQQITHPCDQNHVLSLLPTPIYPEGLFSCDACGDDGNGFSYHCGTCNVDLHSTCATKPLCINHQSHHHPLNLTFSVPYPNKGFCCDICGNSASKQWLYRCNICEFDAHLRCATTESSPTPVQRVQVQHFQTMPSPSIPRYQVLGAPNLAIHNQVRSNSVNTNSRNLTRIMMQGLLGVDIGRAGIDLGGLMGGGGNGTDGSGVLGGIGFDGGAGIDVSGVLQGGIDFGGLGFS